MGISPAAKLTCDGCGARGQELLTIQSGQRLCAGCRTMLGGARPPRGRAARQIEFARTLGFDIASTISRPRLERLLSLHRLVRKYVFDVWRETTGTAPQESGVSVLEAMHFVTWLVTTHRTIALQVARAEKVRERMAVDECRRLRARIGPAAEIDIGRLKPRLLRDRAYRFVAKELQHQLGSDTCKLGIESKLITGKPGRDARPARSRSATKQRPRRRKTS